MRLLERANVGREARKMYEMDGGKGEEKRRKDGERVGVKAFI